MQFYSAMPMITIGNFFFNKHLTKERQLFLQNLLKLCVFTFKPMQQAKKLRKINLGVNGFREGQTSSARAMVNLY